MSAVYHLVDYQTPTVNQPKSTITNISSPGSDQSIMPDTNQSEIRRLEDRIDAVNREGQLRLDVSMAKIQNAIDRIADQTGRIAQDVIEQKVISRSQFQWLSGLVIGSALTAFLGTASLLLGAKQIWSAGVQVGQGLPRTSDSAQSQQASPATSVVVTPQPPLASSTMPTGVSGQATPTVGTTPGPTPSPTR